MNIIIFLVSYFLVLVGTFLFSRYILGPKIILPFYKFMVYLYEVYFTNIHVDKEYMKPKKPHYEDWELRKYRDDYYD